MNPSKLNCLIATNYQVYLPAIKIAIKKNSQKLVGIESEPSQMCLSRKIKRTEAEVLILTLDQDMPNTYYELIEQIQKAHPAIKIILIGESPEDVILISETLVPGFVMSSEPFDELIKVIKKVTQGQNYYSPKVKEILHTKFLSTNTFTNREIQVLILLKQQEEKNQKKEKKIEAID
ncbi:MAG: hypothetical protein ACPGWR_12715 [Ardenticatenaceae bacterium]